MAIAGASQQSGSAFHQEFFDFLTSRLHGGILKFSFKSNPIMADMGGRLLFFPGTWSFDVVKWFELPPKIRRRPL
jgi:hypothetical protein